jgi:TatD DNase family protein
MSYMYSESHCHLSGVTDEVIGKAKKTGFTLLLTSGIDLDSSMEAAASAKKWDIVKGCVGIHPWYADEYTPAVERRFRELAREPEVVAVSEIGLDFKGRMTKEWVREDRYIDRETQIESFERQLRLAESLGVPAIVHDRAEGTEIIDIMLDHGSVETGLAIHGFSKDQGYAERCVDEGIYLSIGLRPLEEAEPGFLEAVKKLPMDYLLTETDSGDPQGVLTVCDKIGELRGLTRKEVGTAATENLMKLCGL